MSEDDQKKPQWKQAADAVNALGGKANAQEVWDVLKHTRADIPFSTVTADLNGIAVNFRSRTSYGMGKEPRRTDSGNRYDLLFKVGKGRHAYFVPYDPKVHGVWEIYADPEASSTYKTSIRPVGNTEFSAQVALDYLDDRYPATRNGTTHIVAYRNRAGRPLAFDPGKDPHAKNAISLFLGARPSCPPADSVIEYAPDKSRNHHLAAHAPGLALGHWAYSAAISSLAGLRTLCAWYDAADTDETSRTTMPEPNTMTLPINRILFGPPGTGKTYRTIDEALRILDAPFLAANTTNRAALKQRFDALAQAGQVRFVTFHQSFSYEDFVEGIRAETEDGQLQYRVEPGVFRSICEDAGGSGQAASELGVREDARIWKISIDGTGRPNSTREYCLAHGEARIGWEQAGDLYNEHLADVPGYAALGTNDRNTLHAFSRDIEPGDVFLCIGSEVTVQAVGVVQSGYEYQPEPPTGVRKDYPNVLPVKWLATGLDLDIRPINAGRRFTLKTVYELTRFGWAELAEFLQDAGIQLQGIEPAPRSVAVPYVLIIDEINRGNISRIFGELITLIEPSKRKGAGEALEVVLPYSKKKFSVPRNVHLIGTMNTADRSLAGLDVALRRRFEFVEMLPDPDVLAGVMVEGISVGALLSAMNRRIEVLLGRDYMLGHAYFMGLMGSPSLTALADVFRRQVLPLLQEYFFEDWQKIAWVLNDHRKPPELQFLHESKGSIAELLGDGQDLPEERHIWTINAAAFDRPEAYRATIEALQVIA